MDDFLLTGEGDLYLAAETVSGRLADTELTDSIIQAIRIRLKWFQGEWRLNPSYGMPYLKEVYVKSPDTALLASRVRREILAAGADSVESVSVTVDRAMREARVVFTATADGQRETEEVALSV